MQTPMAFQTWQQTIKRCQTAYNNQDIDECILLNLEALTLVKPLFEEHFKYHAEVAMAAIMVTYINLASAFTAAENFRAANRALNEASRLIQTVCQSQYLSEAQQVAVLRAAHQLRVEWANSQNPHESQDLETYLEEQAPPMVLTVGERSSAVVH